ncbi:hypothetical protein SAMN05660293_05752 [Dyadobacter psychrophilus]|uniref:Uncharacterized protein n=1 Tax=Dyadobacter psychrophilus TaxID=651661 RepID=A0A1T5HJY1_9BACT|nr:hypothetical protein SAMN05660293_05752 [Dyadobacter psychrophilus]
MPQYNKTKVTYELSISLSRPGPTLEGKARTKGPSYPAYFLISLLGDRGDFILQIPLFNVF